MSYEVAGVICNLCSKAEEVFAHNQDIEGGISMLPGIIDFDSFFCSLFWPAFMVDRGKDLGKPF